MAARGFELDLSYTITPKFVYFSFTPSFAACGRTLQESTGSFFSPNPQENAIDQEKQWCQWRISATHGEKIVLNITELDILDSPKCETDYLEVRDGHWLKSPLLGK